MRIGFIGAGLMGQGLVKNLLKAGHQVRVIAHRNRAPVEALAKQGALEVSSLADLVRDAEVVMLCLTTSAVVERVMADLKPVLKPGQVVIDAGTSEPESTRRLARELEAMGVRFADAPMAGGPAQADAAEVGVMLGADEATQALIEPVLSAYSARIARFGPPGSGQTAKLISNYLVTGMIALVSEAFGAARKARIDWADLYAVILQGSANSGVLRKMIEPVLQGDFDGYKFSLANAAKDIDYYADVAEKLGCRTELSEAVKKLFAQAVETGHGGRNVSHLLDPAIDEVS